MDGHSDTVDTGWETFHRPPHAASVPARTELDAIRAPRLCSLVGITYRQLDYWARTDLLVPSVAVAKGSGTWRFYSVTDVRIARVVKGLLDAGCSLTRIRSLGVVPGLRSLDPEDWGAVLILTTSRAVITSDPGEITRTLAMEGGVAQIMDLAATAVSAADLEVPAHA